MICMTGQSYTSPLRSYSILIASPLLFYSHRLSSPLLSYSHLLLSCSHRPSSPILFSSPLRYYSILIASPILFSSPLLSYSHLLLSYFHTVIIITINNPLHYFLHYQSTHYEANDDCKHNIFQERHGVLILKFGSNLQNSVFLSSTV